jgi:very-short-patch-repair endonuclease
MRLYAKIKAARRLRKVMTKPEVWLWAGLKSQHNAGPVFRRQHAIGPYILDFYCVKAKLAIEVDGETHTRDARRQRDAERDAYFAEMGVMTHRVTARDLLMAPDETITGIIDLTLARMAELGIPLPSPRQGAAPPSP